jgi:hypothetical protein
MNSPVETTSDFRPIVGDRRSAIVVDACAALDLLRLPNRSQSPQAAARAISALTAITNDANDPSGGSLVVLPPPVLLEIASNKVTVMEERKKSITKAINSLMIYHELQKVSLQSSSINLPLEELEQVEIKLEQALQELISCATVLTESNTAMSKAMERVVRNDAPATKGGQAKDCMIVEHLLEVAPKLTAAGCQKIVFISSNTNDYCESPPTVREPLATEFSSLGISFVTSWEWAQHVAFSSEYAS